MNGIALHFDRCNTFTRMKNLLFASLMVLALLAAGGCKEKTPAEKAADAIDKTFNKAKDGVKDGVDAVKDGAKKAGEAVEKAGEKVKETVK